MTDEGMDVCALTCAICYIGLKLMVRWVWFRPEHLRPGFLRHYFLIRSLDFTALLFLFATSFMMVNLGNWPNAANVILSLLAYDLLLRQLFLNIEARRICSHSSRWNLKSAKRRLRRRARQESTF